MEARPWRPQNIGRCSAFLPTDYPALLLWQFQMKHPKVPQAIMSKSFIYLETGPEMDGTTSGHTANQLLMRSPYPGHNATALPKPSWFMSSH